MVEAGIHDPCSLQTFCRTRHPCYADSQPLCAEYKPVSVPYLDPETIQGDELSPIVSLPSHLSDYVQTKDEDMEGEHKPAGYSEKGLAKLGTIDKLGLQHALHKIYQGLMMPVHGNKELISVPEGTSVSDLPVLRSATGAVSITPRGAAQRERILRNCRLPRNLEPPVSLNPSSSVCSLW